MNIQGLQKLTLLDYPEHVAATLFTGGCQLNCPYCHNSELISGPFGPGEDTDAVLAFLKKRQGLLDGVCVSGGEPLLQPDMAMSTLNSARPSSENITQLKISDPSTNGSRARRATTCSASSPATRCAILLSQRIMTRRCAPSLPRQKNICQSLSCAVSSVICRAYPWRNNNI